MNIKEKLKTLIQEAEVYRNQGLIAEALVKYQTAGELINSIDNLKNKDSLLASLGKKIESLDETKEKVDKGPTTPELSKKAQDLIKNLFAFSQNTDKDSGTLEGAVALAKFGQFDRALNELNSLLKSEAVRVEAAKNILRCHLAMATSDDAIDQYHKWFSGDLFLPSQLEAVRVYLDEILKSRGVEIPLPSPLTPGDDSTGEVLLNDDIGLQTEPEEEFLDITSIGITFDSGPNAGRMVEFDVNFQSGNMLSLIISKKDQSLIEGLKNNTKLSNIQFYSPIAIFNGAGVISSKTEIKSGPKQGDYCLDIRIVSS